MSENKKKTAQEEANVKKEEQKTEEPVKTEEPEKAEEQKPEAPVKTELDTAKEALAKEHDQYLRLAAEYDNFRKRSKLERESLYTTVQAETVEKFLPVYDNLERALAQQTEDEAFKKGVEMTMNQLTAVLEKLGVTVFGSVGDPFDPKKHNAVMHMEDETLGENVIADVFQKGFQLGEKIVRFAMVKVAN